MSRPTEMTRTLSQVVSWFYRRDENTTRGNWMGRLDYTAALVVFLLDFSSVWRLPYVAYRSGGGAFWLVYFLMLVLLGIPLLYLESAWGQFAGLGAISMWNVTPICKGIGYATVLVAFIISCYYAALCSWTLLYFVRGFSVEWTEEILSCTNAWNTPDCSTGTDNFDYEHATMNMSDYDGFYVFSYSTSPAEEFFRRNVRDAQLGAPHLGVLDPGTVGCLLVTWILIFLAVGFGAKVLGKVSFGLVLFLYLVGFVFLIRSLTLPGARDGIMYLFYPEWGQIARLQIWTDALFSAFVTLGVGYGVLSTLASFNHFTDHSNVEAGLTLFVVFVSQLCLGCIVFCLTGFLAMTNGLPIHEVATSGPVLTFIPLFEALALLPGRQGWIVLFYLALFLLGLSTQMCLTFTVVTAVVDEFPVSRLSRRVWHLIMTGGVCLVCFLFGLFFITRGGYDVLTLVDTYALTMVPVFVIAGSLIISWIYGFPRFFNDVQLMYGYKPFLMWKAFWGFLAPFGLFLTWLYTWNVNTQLYVGITGVIGNLLYLVTLLPIPIYAAIYTIRNNPTDVIQGPSPAWGPQVAKHRERYEATLSGQRGVETQELLVDEKATPV